jgi:hypothetical protein
MLSDFPIVHPNLQRHCQVHFESKTINWTIMPNFLCLIDVVGRYMSDGNSKLQIRLEKHESSVNAVENEHADSLIPQAVRDFVLPAGFPGDP